MTEFGYTLMCEQNGPRELVDYAVAAEQAGFDFTVCSDHYSPWLAEQGHSPYAWAVLGAAAHATHRMGLMSFVTCPTRRYHPAVVAQKAATLGLLSQDRFTLGLGAGENLNEHIVGDWPHVTTRHRMLTEALEIIRALLAGDELTYAGEFFDVADAVLWDRPQSPVPVGVAVSGRDSVDMAARYADVLIATEPKPDLIDAFDQAGGAGKPRYGQLPICYGPDQGACEQTVHDQFRWSGLGWPVNAELPGPRSFAAATASMTPQQASASITCGPDTEQHVAAIRKYVEAGFTHVAVVQVGGDTQRAFFEYAERELLPALRSGATANRPT